MSENESASEGTVSRRIAAALWSAAGLVIASSAVYAGTTLQALTKTVGELHHSVGMIEQKLTNLPPDKLLMRVAILEENYDREIVMARKRLQAQVDRIEAAMPAIKGLELGGFE